MKVIWDLIVHPGKFFFAVFSRGPFKRLDDEKYLKLLYFARFGRRLNLNAPQSYNEKLQWLKLNDRNFDYIADVDKFAVRDKIEHIFPEKHILVPLIGVYDSFDDIDFRRLPNSFVLKCTHGTHCSIICKDKNYFDVERARVLMSEWLSKNYYYDAREWPYRDVPPRIICEQFLQDSQGSLVDYKFMCFDGKVKIILVHQDINNVTGHHTLDLYTPTWEKTDIEWGVPNSNSLLSRPSKLDECIAICETLSAGRKHVRVDLFIVDDAIYFGELTYYTAAGFKPFKRYADDLKLGSWIVL